jgi:hypothetical protein
MATDYSGLTRNQWPGTWSAASNTIPIVLDTEIRGGLRQVSGDVNDRLTDIPGQRLQEGMLAYVKTGYTADGATRASGGYYKYVLLSGQSRNSSTGAMPNAEGNWSDFSAASVSSGSFSGESTFNGNIVIAATATIIASGTGGSNGQILLSNGTTVFWSTNKLSKLSDVDANNVTGIPGLTSQPANNSVLTYRADYDKYFVLPVSVADTTLSNTTMDGGTFN